MNKKIEYTQYGAILYNPELIDQVSDDIFDPNSWISSSLIHGELKSGGRGHTFVISNGKENFVLRHYLRGGFPRKFIRDKYFWLGEGFTRSFKEWNFLSIIRERGLPVPEPVAARYCRSGCIYRADLITKEIPDIISLATRIKRKKHDKDFWFSLGLSIGRLHSENIYHADLNAYNIQIDSGENIYFLDFDRCRFRRKGFWKNSNLLRLKRSIKKIVNIDPSIVFAIDHWSAFMDGYSSFARSE